MNENKKNVKQFIPLIVLSVVLIAAFAISAYSLLSNAAQNMVKNYTDELASHDMMTIKMYVSDRWTTIRGIYNEFLEKSRKKEIGNITELLEELSYKNSPDDVDICFLLDEQGRLYSTEKHIYESTDAPLKQYFDSESSPFAVLYVDSDEIFPTTTTTTTDYMFYGITFDNTFTVQNGEENVKIIGAAVLNSTSKIRDRLRITCFDNQGYASVIENSGNYIIPDRDSAESNQYKNFYHLLSDRKLLSDISEDEIKQAVLKNETVSFWCKTPSDTKRYVSIYGIEDSEWSFVIALDESVFSEQTNDFIRTMLVVLTVPFICILMIVIISYKMRQRLKNMYSSIAEGVYNRQYYEDKLANMYINALAIVDLDHLKTINDSYGHLAGDAAIKCVADSIIKRTNGNGVVCRFGGDEFIIAFCKNLSDNEFTLTLNNIRAEVEKATFENYPDLKISMSIGGYYGSGETKNILRKSDELLYKAKLTRNAVVTNIEKPMTQKTKPQSV